MNEMKFKRGAAMDADDLNTEDLEQENLTKQ
jgi:hypothetical protein